MGRKRRKGSPPEWWAPLLLCEKTERAGFEPAVRFDTYDGLANRCLRPLGHLSSGSAYGSRSARRKARANVAEWWSNRVRIAPSLRPSTPVVQPQHVVDLAGDFLEAEPGVKGLAALVLDQ